MRQTLAVIAGPVCALLIILFLDLDPSNPMVTRMAAITVWMAIWWFSEAVHLAVTALIPFAFMPLLGIAEPKVVAFQYMDQVIFLFIGGFLLSFAMERWNLHERIAMRILMFVGTKSSNMLLGVMLTAFLISMWISNTATVMMLLSAVLAIIHMSHQLGGNSNEQQGFAKALLIGLAYSATIGGMATLVGTPPNMIFVRMYTEAYPDAQPVTFMSWFVIGFPIAIIMLLFCFFTLKKLFLQGNNSPLIDRDYFKQEYAKLGKMNFEQKFTGSIFGLTALLWFTRADIDFGSFVFPGWSNLFSKPDFIQDSTVAVVMSLFLFLIPSRQERGKHLLNWDEARRLPFDIILLFGSGFALAKGFELSGLSTWIAAKLSVFHEAPLWMIILMIIVMVTIISEFASNVASIQLVLPILIAFQKDLSINPLLLMMPATFAASLGFILPVATAPNTIVFGTQRLTVRDMGRAGVVMDIAGILIIWLLCLLLLG